MAGRLDGRVAVITGGCSGIGLATARRFAAEGARVVIGDIDAERGPQVADEVQGAFARTDVTDPESVAALFALAKGSYGSVDVAFNNAGISPPDDDSILTTGLEAWRRVQEVNLTSVYLMCRAVIPHMRASGGGSIVNVSSGAGLRGMHANPAYVAAKAGVVALTRALALDHGPEGIRTNCVAPGPVATPLMRRNRTPDEIAVIARQSIVGRLGEPEELAQVIAWLASDESSYVMGQTIAVDGGVASAI